MSRDSCTPDEWTGPLVDPDVVPDVERRDFLKATSAAAALGIFGSESAVAAETEYYRKQRPTVFTEADRQNAADNIETYDWAAAERDRAVEGAEAVLESWSLEELWRLVPSQNVPRSYILTPWISYVTTTDWSFDRLDGVESVYGTAPTFDWEITNTVEIDGEQREITIPTNDFAAYRESGRDEAGEFQPALADDSLLVNEKHPELGDGWGVDDGTGFVDEEGYLRDDGEATWWNPVAWINHWAVIYGMRQLCVELADAYLYTGDERYVTPVAVVLDRVADVYHDLSLNRMREERPHTADDFPEAGYHNSSGTGRGTFVGAIWEAYQIREQLRNYDKVFPGMDGDDELLDVLSDMGGAYPDIGGKNSIGAIRENIETGVLQEMLPAVKNAQIRGNFGFHQQTLGVAAIAADDPEEFTGEAIDFVFQPGTLLHPDDSPTGQWRSTGGDVFGFLMGSPQSGYWVDEDGYPSESAVHYNTSQQNSLESLAEELAGYDAYEGADLYENPKFKNAVNSHWQLTFNQYIPQIANTHGCGNPKAVAGATPRNDRVVQNVDFALTGFDRYRTVELAQWAYMLNGFSTDGLERGIHHPDPIGIKDEIEAIVGEHGPYVDPGSNQQSGYGFSALRDGEGSNLRGVYQYYGRNYFDYQAGNSVGSAHTHRDTHNIGVYGYDLDLSPELGRQGHDWEDNDLDSWVESTPAHNTVTVDEENINHPQWVGYPLHHDYNDRVQLMDVESRYAYEQTDAFRRTTAMVNVDEQASYIVDVFRVDGGDDHHFSFHGMTSFDVVAEGVELEPQDGGTYEGENVGFTDGGPFSYLYDVERDDSPEDRFSIDWDIEDYWKVRDDDGVPVHLRLTMLNDVDDVALATGRPAEQVRENNPQELRFVLAHRAGESLTSDFTSVIEPYEGSRAVKSIEKAPVETDDADADLDDIVALRIELTNGRTDYVVRSLDRDSNFVIDDRFIFKGFFAVYAERNGDAEFVYTNDTKLLRVTGGGSPLVQRNQSRVRGEVESFTKEITLENEIGLKITNTPRDVDLEDLVGQSIVIEPAPPDPVPDGVQTDRRYSVVARDRRNASIQIEDINSDRGNRATIDIGEHTLIRRFYTNDPDDGYSYSIEEGAAFDLPIGELIE